MTPSLPSLPFIFIINLPQRTDRREHMTGLMAALGIESYEFVAPEVPTAIEHADWTGVTRNELSLVLTAQGIMHQAQERGMDRFMIFEDDVVTVQPPKKVAAKMRAAIGALPAEWDMLYFEYCYESCGMMERHNEHLYRVANPLCAASILFNGTSVPKILACMDAYKKNLDNTYAACLKQGGLVGFSVSPPLFFQDHAFETNLQITYATYLKSFFVDTNDYDPDAHDLKKSICKMDLVVSHIKWLNVMLTLMALTIICILLCVAVTRYGLCVPNTRAKVA